jgi:hypothetical protein
MDPIASNGRCRRSTGNEVLIFCSENAYCIQECLSTAHESTGIGERRVAGRGVGVRCTRSGLRIFGGWRSLMDDGAAPRVCPGPVMRY